MTYRLRLYSFLLLMTVGFILAACIGLNRPPLTATSTATPGPGSVALIVLDNFSEQAATPNCLYLTDGEGNYVKPGVPKENLITQSYLIRGLEHGDLVYQDMENLISTTVITGSAPATGPITMTTISTATHMHEWSMNGQKLYVVGIDVQPINTASQRITQTIAALKHLNPSVSHFVLNASFAVVPCQLKKDLNLYLTTNPTSTNDLPADLNTLYKSLKLLSPQYISTTQITDILASGLAMRFANITLHPMPSQSMDCQSKYQNLWATTPYTIYHSEAKDFAEKLVANPLIKMLQGNREMVTVAAAGNADFGFPFAPANLPNIISTSGGDGQHTDPCAFTSNSAKWLVENDVFTYPNHIPGVAVTGLCLDTGGISSGCITGTITTSVQLNGTSFAAPRLAFYIARHLLLYGDKTGCVEKLRKTEPNNQPNLDPFDQEECKDPVP